MSNSREEEVSLASKSIRPEKKKAVDAQRGILIVSCNIRGSCVWLIDVLMDSRVRALNIMNISGTWYNTVYLITFFLFVFLVRLMSESG